MFGTKPTRLKVLLTLTAFLTLSHQQAFGDAIAWQNPSSTSWSDAANWYNINSSTSGVGPSSTDDVLLQLSNITYNYDVTTSSLTFPSTTINSLTINGDYGTLLLGSNSLTVTNGITVNSGFPSGTSSNGISLAGGTLGAGGAFFNGGTLTLASGSAVTAGPLTNAGGSISLSGSGNTLTVGDFDNTFGSISVDSGSTFQSTGKFANLNGAGLWSGGTYTVTGTLQYALDNTGAGPTGITGIDTTTSVTLNGDGTLPGTGLITYDGSSNALGGLQTNAGTFTLNGAVLTIGNSLANNNGGYLRVENSGALNVNGVLNNTNGATFVLNGSSTTGTILGPTGATGETTGLNNTASTIRVDNSSNLTVGATGGPYAVDVSNSSNSSLTVQGLSTMTVNGNLNNTNSTVTVRGSTNCQNDGCSWSQLNVTGNITNTGNSVVSIYHGGQLNSDLNSGGSFTNVLGGQLQLATGGVAYGGSLDNQAGGAVALDTGASLYVTGALKNEGKVDLNSNGYASYVSAGAIINSNSFNVTGTDGNQGSYYSQADAGAFINKSGGTLTIGGGINGGTGGLVTANFFKNYGTVNVNGGQDSNSSSGPGGLVVSGNLINSSGGTLTTGAGVGGLNGGLVIVFGNLKNYGTINDNASVSEIPSGGGIYVGEQFTNGSTGSVTVAGGAGGNDGSELGVGIFMNYGTVMVGGTDGSAFSGDLSVNGYFDQSCNQGQGCDVNGTYTQDGSTSSTTVNGTMEAAGVLIMNGALQVNGTLSMGSYDSNDDFVPGGTVEVSGSAPGVGGVLSGGGTINGDVLIDANGTIYPGDPADMTINGSLTMDGLQDEDIIGPNTSAGNFDAITVSGNVNFDGNLDVLGNFVPGVGIANGYVIVNWQGTTGDENLTIVDPSIGGGLYWTLDWNNPGELILYVENRGNATTPEPGSLLLLGTGIASLLAARRKRRVA